MLNRANLIKSIRQCILGAVGTLIPSFAIPLKQAQSSKTLLVLCYHNIVASSYNEDSCDDYCFLNLPQNIFEKQIQWVAKNFDIIHLDDLINRNNIPDKAALITFDDGFKSVHSVAFPILKCLKAAATVFLTGAHINQRRVPWISHLHYILDKAYLERKPNTINIGNCRYRPCVKSEKIKLMKMLKSLLKEKHFKDISKVLIDLEKNFEIYLPAKIISEKFLSEAEIDELSEYGWTIGNHTYNHVNLNCLTEEEIRNEIVYTQRALRQFKQYREVLAIPFGDLSYFSQMTLNIARQTGMDYFFSTRGELNRLHDNKSLVDRIVCETFSFNYFKFLAEGKKREIENIIKRIPWIGTK